MRSSLAAFALLVPILTVAPASAQDAEPPPDSPFRLDQVASLAWRQLGPSNMSGRLTDMATAGDTWYVASAGGGLFKTENQGTTWTRLFQNEPVVSIGAVAVAGSQPDVVWVGSGEENARNSVSWGDGVYKSTDGGKTWKHKGLADSFQIGHVAIHPTDPDVVFVAALGRLWGDNRERGVFRTKDGGDTWEHVLFLDERTGCIDVRIHPGNPQLLLACAYERRRGMFDDNDPEVRFGDKAGIYRSSDGGDTWTRIVDGLPTCRWGRSGLSLYGKDPNVVFAIIETERSGWATGSEKDPPNARRRRGSAYLGVRGEDAPADGGALLSAITDDSPAQQAGLQDGDVVIRVGGRDVSSYDDLTGAIRRARGDSKSNYLVKRGDAEVELEVTYGTRPGGDNVREGGPNSGRLGGQNANVQDSQGDDGFETGGVFRSADAGLTWQRVNSLTERPFYYSVIAVDPGDESHLYACGVSLWGSDNGGETFRAIHRNQIHVDFHVLWVDPKDGRHLVVGGDGGLNASWDRGRTWEMLPNLPCGQFYHVDVDTSLPYNVYGGLQDNGSWGGPSRTRWREGIGWDDWFKTYSGDGFGAAVDHNDPNVIFFTSQNGNVGRFDRRTMRAAPVSRPRGRGVNLAWNWDTPFFLSPHNSRILYFAGSRPLRSLDHGRSSELLGDVTLGLTDKGTATAFAESPRVAGLLWVGTDDGALWRSDDGGRSWTELHGRIVGLPGPRYVSSIHPSGHDDGRVYVTFDGHRSDDFETYVFVSEDRGDTWKAIDANLPDEPAHVVVEDPVNADLLFVGTEFGCWVSLDRGGRWLPLGAGLPTVAVRDAVTPRHDADLVVATHGQGLWVLDTAPLRQLTAEVAAEPAHLFVPEPAVLWRMTSVGRGAADKEFFADNPPYGATLYVWLREAPEQAPKLTIHDVVGEEVASLNLARRAGVQAVQWSAQRAGRRRMRMPVEPGAYAARLHLGDDTLVRAVTLLPDPGDAGSADPSSPLPSASDRR